MKKLAPILFLALSASAFADLPAEHPCNEFDARKAQAQRAVDAYMRDAQRAEAKLRSVESRLFDAESQLSGYTSRMQSLQTELASLQAQMGSVRSQQQRRMALTNLIASKETERRSLLTQAQNERDLNRKRPLLLAANRLQVEVNQLTAEAQMLDQDLARSNNLNGLILQKQAELAQVERDMNDTARSLNLPSLRQLVDEARMEVGRSSENRQGLESELNRASFHVEMCYGYIELSAKYPVALDTARRVNLEGCRNVRPMNYPEPMHMQAQAEVIQKMCSPR